jgi:hypothetical protein
MKVRLSDIKSIIRDALLSEEGDVYSAETAVEAMAGSLPEELLPAATLAVVYFIRKQSIIEEGISV